MAIELGSLKKGQGDTSAAAKHLPLAQKTTHGFDVPHDANTVQPRLLTELPPQAEPSRRQCLRTVQPASRQLGTHNLQLPTMGRPPRKDASISERPATHTKRRIRSPMQPPSHRRAIHGDTGRLAIVKDITDPTLFTLNGDTKGGTIIVGTNEIPERRTPAALKVGHERD